MEPGTTLGPYRIERELGSGGMGRVYAGTVEGRCPGLEPGTRVALKVLHPHLLPTPGFFKRFLREAQIGRAVRHENVVRTFDCDATGDAHFLVMEYVEGQTLRALLDELERVPEELCRHVAREMCRGLAAIHAAGVIHRDVKPDNVLITPDHVVKVMDLGVARLTGEVLRLSQSGTFVGSIHYAAPESFREGGKHVDGRADLHALGLVLYELATGVNPYLAEDVPQTLKKILHEQPRRLGEIQPQLSPFFEEAVHCLLAKDPSERFGSADELLIAFEEGEDSAWWKARTKAIRAATRRPLRRIRIPRETAVHGRENELAKLRGLFERVQVGDGQVVLIEGEAGIGKSRLVDELIARLQQDGEELDFLFGSYPPGGAASAAGAFSTAFREQLGEEGAAAYLPRTPLLVPAFDAVLRGDAMPSDAQRLTGDSLATCFVQAARTLAAERPTVILIDDLHFAPADARNLFSALATALSGDRVLLIGTTRPGLEGDWRANTTRGAHATHIQVERLFPKDLAALLKDCFHSEKLALALAGQIGMKSDGNPFFAFEIIRGLREGQFITQGEDGTWVSTRVIDQIQIPSSVLDLVNARVASLSREERDLLDVAACWGYEFDPVLIADVTGIARIPLLKDLAQIERAHRLIRSSGRRFVFDHHQVQEALYASLPEMLREEYHGALAAALEQRTGVGESDVATLEGPLCVNLCEHFLKSTEPARAGRYLDPALSHLEGSYLTAQAADLAERALGTPGVLEGRDRVTVLLRHADHLDAFGSRDRQLEVSLEAQALATSIGDRGLEAWATRVVGVCHLRTSRYSEAGVCMQRALELAEEMGDLAAESKARLNLAVVLRSEGRLEESRAHNERARELARRAGNRRGEAMATGNLGAVFWARGRFVEAQECHELQLAYSREIGSRAGEARGLGNLGVALSSQGRLEEARACHARALEIAREIGERRSESIAVANLGNLCWMEGRTQDAREYFETSIALSREIGQPSAQAHGIGNLGLLSWLEGRLEEARELSERHLALARELGERGDEALALHNLGNVLMASGDAAAALKCLTDTLDLAGDIGLVQLVARTDLLIGALHAEAGETDAARAHLIAARDSAQTHGFFNSGVLSRCRLAALGAGDVQGDVADALSAFAEHEDRLSALSRRTARYLLWRATGDREHLVQAKRELDEALEKIPAEYRQTSLANVPLHRDIAAASTE